VVVVAGTVVVVVPDVVVVVGAVVVVAGTVVVVVLEVDAGPLTSATTIELEVGVMDACEVQTLRTRVHDPVEVCA
jgi:hypothetical protein